MINKFNIIILMEETTVIYILKFLITMKKNIIKPNVNV